MKFPGTVFFLFTLVSFTFSTEKNDNITLELLQILFRHGDRVPDSIETYKMDPYLQEFIDAGYGQLTPNGQLRLFKFGKLLRQKYDAFLGSYRFNKVYAYSTYSDRTKVSLQALLGGLYPANSSESCNDDTLKWLPIPTHQDKGNDGFLTSYYTRPCSKFTQAFKEVKNATEILTEFEKYHVFRNFLNNVTGYMINETTDTYKLYHNMKGVVSMNLSLPSWLTDENFKKLENLFGLMWDHLTLSQSLKRIGAGPIVKNFLDNIENSNSNKDGGKKIYLYCGHDINLASFTRAHNFTHLPVHPDYGSAIIVEKLRGVDNQVYLRMFFWTGVSEEMIPLNFTGIGYDIPLALYIDRVNPILPHSDDCIYTKN